MSQIPLTADLTPFFQQGEFAQSVTFTGIGVITAIITDNYDELDGGSVGIEGAQVICIVKSSDVPGIQHGQAVVVGTENFKVVNIRFDNTGITRLQLSRDD